MMVEGDTEVYDVFFSFLCIKVDLVYLEVLKRESLIGNNSECPAYFFIIPVHLSPANKARKSVCVYKVR